MSDGERHSVNLGRGLLRLWIALSALWIVAASGYYLWPRTDEHCKHSFNRNVGCWGFLYRGYTLVSVPVFLPDRAQGIAWEELTPLQQTVGAWLRLGDTSPPPLSDTEKEQCRTRSSIQPDDAAFYRRILRCLETPYDARTINYAIIPISELKPAEFTRYQSEWIAPLKTELITNIEKTVFILFGFPFVAGIMVYVAFNAIRWVHSGFRGG